MNVASFGGVVFETSSEKVKTIDGLKKDIKATFTSHDVANGKPKLQHVGRELSTMSFSVTLRATLGVNPKNEYAELEKMLRKGDAYNFFLGSELLGKFVLESLGASYENIDNKGQVWGISATISLKEYN